VPETSSCRPGTDHRFRFSRDPGTAKPTSRILWSFPSSWPKLPAMLASTSLSVLSIDDHRVVSADKRTSRPLADRVTTSSATTYHHGGPPASFRNKEAAGLGPLTDSIHRADSCKHRELQHWSHSSRLATPRLMTLSISCWPWSVGEWISLNLVCHSPIPQQTAPLSRSQTWCFILYTLSALSDAVPRSLSNRGSPTLRYLVRSERRETEDSKLPYSSWVNPLA